MSEYWKSTPNYWCTYCRTYVRDTGICRRQHESSSKHKHAVNRHIRTLSRDKERAKRQESLFQSELRRIQSAAAINNALNPYASPSSSASTYRSPIVHSNHPTSNLHNPNSNPSFTHHKIPTTNPRNFTSSQASSSTAFPPHPYPRNSKH